MDRSDSTPPATIMPCEDTPAAGWDPDSVWRARVRRTRLLDDGNGPRIAVETVSAGWDPHETWRIRVHAPRRTAR